MTETPTSARTRGIHHAPEPLDGGAACHLMCAIPGGIRVDLTAPAAG